MEFIVVQQIHLAYGTEVLSKNGTKLVKFTTTEKICRAERSTQRTILMKKEMIVVKIIRRKL